MPALGTARVLLWLAPLLWSSNYIIARLVDGLIAPHALPHATPHALSPGRWAVAAAIRLTWMGRGMWAQVAPVRRESLHQRVLGFLDMCICGAWVYIAARTMSSTSIALIYAVTPTTRLPEGLDGHAALRLGCGGAGDGGGGAARRAVVRRVFGPAARAGCVAHGDDVVPGAGAPLAWLMLGEVPGQYHVVGAAMLLPNIWPASRKQCDGVPGSD